MTVLVLFKFLKIIPKGHHNLQQAITPDQITQQNSCRGQDGLKGSKGTLRPEFLGQYLTLAF
jgi:hypothetical protein